MAKVSKSGKARMKQLHQAMVGPMEAKVTEPPSTIDIKATQLPEIKDWDVGKTYEITLKAKMRSKSEGGYDGKQPLRATFEIVNATPETESAAEDTGSDEDD